MKIVTVPNRWIHCLLQDSAVHVLVVVCSQAGSCRLFHRAVRLRPLYRFRVLEPCW
jgi:hypothetical protein